MGPSYILPDGELYKLNEHGFRTHIIYETYITKNPQSKRCFTNTKHYIRLNDTLPLEVLTELPIEEPTKEQYETLEWFFNDLLDRGYTFVEVGIEPTGSIVKKWTPDVQFYNKFDLLETKPEFIINRIKKFYREHSI